MNTDEITKILEDPVGRKDNNKVVTEGSVRASDFRNERGDTTLSHSTEYTERGSSDRLLHNHLLCE